jgi:hypothetical protein
MNMIIESRAMAEDCATGVKNARSTAQQGLLAVHFDTSSGHRFACEFCNEPRASGPVFTLWLKDFTASIQVTY